MAAQVPHEVMFQNQLQFNLNVPLTTYNMATHYHRPQAITIERAASAPSCQGFPMAQLANKQHSQHVASQREQPADFNFSVLSQDKMAAAVQMAQRDLKNGKLQLKNEQSSSGSRRRSPSPGQHGKPVHGTRYWERQRSRMPSKPQKSVASKGYRTSVREHDKNRAPRTSSSQTPPASPVRPTSFLNTRAVMDKPCGENVPTRDTPSLTRVSRVPTDDIEKLQVEMELCLQQIESVQKRVLSEGSTDFLRDHQSHSQLGEEEEEKRRRQRTSEQSHRALRTIYNLQQQVREIERQMAKLPPQSRATKKSQASLRLAMVNKGAVRLLQNFVNQLPQQDLRSGLPSHFGDLADLVRQVTLLSAGASAEGGKVKDVKKSSLSPVGTDLIAMVDHVEKLNQDWQKEMLNQEAVPVFGKEKPPFVTNFKNEKSAFTKEQVRRPQLQNTRGQDVWYTERKAMLQAGIKALLNARQRKVSKPKQNLHPYAAELGQPPPWPKGLSNKIPTRKAPPSRRGFLRPSQAKPQKMPAIQFMTHFADPTITANLKASSMLHNPITSPEAKWESAANKQRKKVNFAVGASPKAQYHASYPGASAKRHPRRSRSLSPRGPRMHRHDSADSRDRSPSSYYNSDSDSMFGYHSADDLSSPQAVYSFESRSSSHRRHRSASPAGRSTHRSHRSPASRRRFFLADADPALVEELCPEDGRSVQSNDSSPARTSLKSHRKEAASLSPYIHQAERKLRERMVPLLRNGSMAANNLDGDDEFDQVADTIMDEVVNEVTQEFTAREREAGATESAASIIDNPTLENIMQALERMETENERLRQKYTSFTFHDSAPVRRRYQKASEVFAEFRSEQPRDPPAFEVTNTRPEPQDTLAIPRVFTEALSEDPLIFTKDSKAYRSHVKFHQQGEGDRGSVSGSTVPPPLASQRQVPSAVRPKKLLSMKQTVVERITDSVERFEYYQRGLKHHLGKKNPFQLYESIADGILKTCCEEVARELEHINADMAENIYTSEFMDENGMPLAPPGLAEDFETDGTAAQNLRDSAAAQRSVEAAVSKAVTSLMLPLDEADIPIMSPKRIAETEEDTSPPWDTSLKHVYDATALYEASITEKAPTDFSRGRSGKVGAREEDTHMEGDEDYDYDDDYTDISDEDEEDEDDESESPSPSP